MSDQQEFTSKAPEGSKFPKAYVKFVEISYKHVIEVLDELPQGGRRDVLRALAVRYRDDLAAISKPA